MAPVEAVGVPVHSQDRAHAAAHGIQMLPLAVGAVLSPCERGLKRIQIRQIDVRHIVGYGVAAAALGVPGDLHGEVGAGISGIGRDHGIGKVLRKFLTEGERLSRFGHRLGGSCVLLMGGWLNVVLHLRQRGGSSAQSPDGRLVQKVVVAKDQKGCGQNIRRQKQGNGPAASGGRSRFLMRVHGSCAPLLWVSFSGRSPASGRKS